MIHSLLFFQFALLYIPILVIGLIVYGSDFNEPTGWVYLGSLAFISILHFSRRLWSVFMGRLATMLFLLIGVTVGMVAYRDLHFSFWDEHSLKQAILVSILGVCSYLASVYAARVLLGKVSEDRLDHSATEMMKCLVIFAVVWLISVAYPMTAVIAVIIILAIAMVWLEPAVALLGKTVKGQFARQYLLFLFTLDAAIIIWDSEIDTRWGGYIALTMITTALGIYLAGLKKPAILYVGYGLGVLNIIVLIVFPVYVLNYLHSFVAGIALGICLAGVQSAQMTGGSLAKQKIDEAMNYWPSIFLALGLGAGFYAHLTIAHWRAVLLLPLLFVISRVIKTNIPAQ